MSPLCLSELPFQLGFTLSRPALERFATTVKVPDKPESLTHIGRSVGLLRVLAIRRDGENNLILLTHSNMSYAHYLVRHPKGDSPRLRHKTYLGQGWYRSSYGM